jgi:FKBP-type peptidyl-prolyl cis-trans isomerase
MSTQKIYVYLLLLSIIVLNSCNTNEFTRTDNDIYYKFITENDDSTKVKVDDILILKLIYTNEKGDVIFDSRELGRDYKMILKKPNYIGSIDEAIAMMHVGDSAIFKVDATDFYTLSRGYKELPEEVKFGGKLIFYVKILGIADNLQVKKEKQELAADKQKHEEEMLQDFLQKENITVKPSSSGLYHVVLTKGNGKKPQKGDKLVIHYTGKFINGEIFDSSLKRGKPLIYNFGDSGFIQGWQEGISYMTEGEKAELIIPSHLAYGDKKTGPIPAYSTLIFEIELLKIEK